MRREDARLLTGQGRFAADFAQDDQVFGVFLRSDRAHARVLGIDASAAREMLGVLAVLMAQDVSTAKPFWTLASPHGVLTPLRAPERPLLASDRVRYVGEPIALVVAASEDLARDAAEHILVGYEDLPAVTDPLAAVAEGAPLLYEEIPGNVCYAQSHGDAARTEAALKASAHVVRLALRNNRLVPSPLEPRAVLASFDPGGGYRIALSTQGMPRMQAELADLLGVPREKVRIETGDVGGGFGVRTPAYAEYVTLLHAARSLGRTVKWVSTRSETFVSEHHARDGNLEGELGLDGEGHFLAMRFCFTANMGAYLSYKSAFIAATNPGTTMAGIYRTPAIHGAIRCVLTNTAIVGPYRGSGRPEMATMIERLIDEAADRLDMDRIELRRRNMIPRTPWTTATGVEYDSGDFPGVLARALAASEWNDFPARRRASAIRGRLRGIGLSCFMEATGGPNKEHAAFRFTAKGDLEIHCGTQSTGQGHETVFPQMVAAWLGLPEQRVRLVQGDHGLAVESGGTIASRSLVAAGGALKIGAEAVIARARGLAARELETDSVDLEFAGGEFRVAGTDRAIGLAELIAGACPPSGPHPLDVDAVFDVKTTFPNGCHVAEVEVDPETGVVTVERYTAVDDFGHVQHEGIVEGQLHGGVAQGIGQALTEHCRYDASSGQLLTGSFADYALPRADDLPQVVVLHHGQPSTHHPFGAKGAGESGATGAPGAVMNAIADALRACGAAQVDMPATPAAVWQAIRSATRAKSIER
jgi:carbon-monoxide dehydrogenase large subunit